jgi:hypothetical protein
MRVDPFGTERYDWKLPLQIRILGSKGEEFHEGCLAKAMLVQFGNHLAGGDFADEVDEMGPDLYHTTTLDWEVSGSDVVIGPEVTAGGDHLG